MAENEPHRQGALVTLKDIPGGYLFHGTSILGLANILSDDRIIAVDDDEEYVGVSTTVRIARAAAYADAADHYKREDLVAVYGRDSIPSNLDGSHGAVIVLDAERILRDYEIRAVSWQMSDPIEERIVGDVKNLRHYLAGLIYREEEIEAWTEAMEEVSAQPKQNFRFHWAVEDCHKTLRALRALRSAGLTPLDAGEFAGAPPPAGPDPDTDELRPATI